MLEIEDRRDALRRQQADAIARLSRWLGESDRRVAMTVYKSPGCGCCEKWVEHMVQAGFKVRVEHPADLTPVKAKYGIGEALQACHSAVIDGYVFEGHIPAGDIQRFLKEKPANAKGLAVPKMPKGSPGMELDAEASGDELTHETHHPGGDDVSGLYVATISRGGTEAIKGHLRRASQQVKRDGHQLKWESVLASMPADVLKSARMRDIMTAYYDISRKASSG